jgi:hypothetical protein
MLWELLSLALVGAAVGALGRLAAPGPGPWPWLVAVAAGLAGSLAGGLLTSVALGRTHRVTIFTVAVLFAAMSTLAAAIVRRGRARALPPE